MNKTYVSFLALCLMVLTTLTANGAKRTWNFTNWSDATKANLAAEAATFVQDEAGAWPATTLWRSYEKAGGPTETDPDRGGAAYWYGSLNPGANITANSVEIEELNGLEFPTMTAGSLAIAIDYPSTSLGTYNGGSYLWIGGKNNVMTIPAVKPGSTITIMVESHKISDGRGVALTIDGTAVAPIEGSEKPTELTKCVWKVPYVEANTVDAVFTNNSGCHIYSIEVDEDIYADVQMTWIDYDSPDFSAGAIDAGETARSGYNKISNGSVENANTGWGENKITYLKVDASAVPGIISKATLTAEVSGSSDNKRATTWGVGYNSSEWSADMTWNTADRSIVTIGETQSTSTKSASIFESKSFDITDAVMNDEDKVVTLLVYETAAAGGYIKNPKVVVEYSLGAIVPYTVNFLDENGETLKEPATYEAPVGKEVVASDDDIAAFKNTAGDKKYIYKSGNETIIIDEDETKNVINLVFREAATYNYVVVAKDADGNVIKEEASKGTNFEGETFNLGYPRYALLDGQLYEAGKLSSDRKGYYKTVTLDTDNYVLDITYSKKEGADNVIYYSEAEEVNSYYLKELTTSNAAIRASQGKAAYLGYDAQLVQLSAGVYEVTAGLFDATKGYETLADTIRFALDRSVALEFAINGVNLSEQTKQIVVPNDGSWLAWMKGGNENWGLDYVFVKKVSDEVPYTAAASIAEAKALPNGTPVALTLNNAKVSLSTVTDEDMYPSYSFIEDETGALALNRMFAATVEPNLVKDNSYTGTIYGSFAFDTFGRPVFSVTAKTAASEIAPTPCEIVPAEVTVGTINTEAGFADYYGKYVTLKNVTWGKKEDAWGGSDYYLVATHTEGEGEEAVEVNDSIYFYDQYYQFPANLPNFISFNSIRGFVDKFYDGTVSFYPYGEYDAVVKSATKAANIGALKEVTAGDDVILTLDKAVVTAYLQGHSGNIVLLEDATGGIQVQTGNIWWGEAGLTDMLGLTRDSLEISGTIYCRLESNNMIVMNDSTETRSEFTVNPELVPVNPTVVTLDKVLDNNYLNRLIKVKKLASVNVGTADPYYPEYVMMEPYFVQGTDTVGIYDMFNVLEYDEQYNVVEIPNIKSVTGIIIKGSEATDWSPATPNTLAPVAIEKMTFKEFTENEYFVPTAETVSQAVAEGWFDGGETLKSDKKGTIDPLTGFEVAATKMPYAGVKKGNDSKSVTVYVTGLTEIRGIAASTSSTANRALEISAENVADGTIAYAFADNAPNTSSVATLALDPEAQYIVSFAGVDEAHEKGDDVALFGIWFLKDVTTTGVKDINANADIEGLTNGEVYNLNGVRVREAGQGIGGLKKGVYLMKNGKKVVVK